VERIVIVSEDPARVRAALASGREPPVVVDSLAKIERESGATVFIVDDDRFEADPVAEIERVRRRVPAARFVFVCTTKDTERARSLASRGAVLPLPLDAERLELALRQAFALGSMSAQAAAIRPSGRSPTLDGRIPLVRKPK